MLKRSLFAAITFTVIITACGGGSADPTATPEPTATSPPTPTTASSGESSPTGLQAPPTDGPDVRQEGRMLGDPDASVEIVEYGDFQ